MLWIHGGGYAIGTPERSLATARRLVAAANCVVVLPDHRLSPEAPYPAALHDCYDALLWLRDHAGELGVADDQLVVGGESAGGGLTAAVTLLARDRGEVAVAVQVPLYPMIDDRPTASSRANATPVWNTNNDDTAWDLYLGDLRGGDVPAYAAPARATDLAGLPPTLTSVGDVEPFHDAVVDWCAPAGGRCAGPLRGLRGRLPRLRPGGPVGAGQPARPRLPARRVPRPPLPPPRAAASPPLT